MCCELWCVDYGDCVSGLYGVSGLSLRAYLLLAIMFASLCRLTRWLHASFSFLFNHFFFFNSPLWQAWLGLRLWLFPLAWSTDGLMVYAVFLLCFLVVPLRLFVCDGETFGFVAVRTGPHLCDASLTSFCGLPLLKTRNLDSDWGCWLYWMTLSVHHSAEADLWYAMCHQCGFFRLTHWILRRDALTFSRVVFSQSKCYINVQWEYY